MKRINKLINRILRKKRKALKHRKTTAGHYNKNHVTISDNIRDFADTLILARQEAKNDPEEADLDKLTDKHIIQTLSDIFFGK